MITDATQFTWKVHINWKLDRNIRTKKIEKISVNVTRKPHQKSHMISTSLILFVTTYNTIQTNTRTNLLYVQGKLCNAHKVSHVLFLPPNRLPFFSHTYS